MNIECDYIIDKIIREDVELDYEYAVNTLISEGYEENIILCLKMAGRIPGEVKIPNNLEGSGLIIAVGSNDLNPPHFHIYRNETDLGMWSNGACLRIDRNGYYEHGRNREMLTEDELEAVVTKLKENHPAIRWNCTNWEYLVDLWNTNNPRFPVDANLEMPRYDYKTLTKYKD